MPTDPRAALDRFVAALEAHLFAAQQRRGDDDPAVARAYDTLADAFETYDEALYAACHETTPFELYDEDDEDDEDDDLDEDDDDEGDDDEDDDIDPDDLAPDDFDDHVDPELEADLG